MGERTLAESFFTAAHETAKRAPRVKIKAMARRLLFALALLFAAGNALAAPAITIDPPTGYINDRAGMFSAATVARLENFLADFERSDSTHIHVLTVPNLGGQPPAIFTLTVAQQWGLRQKGKNTNNSALLLIARDERLVHIEPGYGLQERLSGLNAKSIIYTVIAPAFRRGDFDNGLTLGLKAMTAAIKGEYRAAVSATSQAGPPAPIPAIAPPTGHINDRAGMLDTATVTMLEKFLADFEKSDAVNIIVLTVPTLGGLPFEDFSQALVKQWGFDQKDKENIALLFIAKDEGLIRIGGGPGLRGRLSNLIINHTIDTTIMPAFRRGLFDLAVTNGAEAMVAAINDKYLAGGGGVQTAQSALALAMSPPTGRINDRARMLKAATIAELENFLADFAKNDPTEITVLTVPDLGGQPLETFSRNVAAQWGISQKGKKDSVLLLIAKDKRQSRIELSDDLKDRNIGMNTDSSFFTKVVAPALRKGDFDAGVNFGVKGIVSFLKLDSCVDDGHAGILHVDDRAGMLKAATVKRLESLLADFEKRQCTQIIVLTASDTDTGGQSFEEFSEAVRRKLWGADQTGKLNHAFRLLIVRNKGSGARFNITTRYSWAGHLNYMTADYISGHIIAPAFGRSDFDTGVTRGVEAMVAAVKGQFQASGDSSGKFFNSGGGFSGGAGSSARW